MRFFEHDSTVYAMVLDRYWRAESIFSEVSVSTFEFRIDFLSKLAYFSQFILRLRPTAEMQLRGANKFFF